MKILHMIARWLAANHHTRCSLWLLVVCSELVSKVLVHLRVEKRFKINKYYVSTNDIKRILLLLLLFSRWNDGFECFGGFFFFFEKKKV
jgi:hypothetical protein